MIIYRQGDVVEAFKNGEIDVLVHGVNCQGKMNSGIAKQIREEFPVVFEEYQKYMLLGKELMGAGNLVMFDGGEGKGLRYIINAFTQNNYGYNGQKYCSYDAIDKVMHDLTCLKGPIGMPKIGAGLGGGDWKVIEAIINSHFKDRDVYVYTLEELPKSSGKNDLG